MPKKSEDFKFYVTAIWDDEAEVYTSESNIRGLHIVTKTLQEFEEVMEDAAFDLIMSNHIASKNLDNRPVREVFPKLTFRVPVPDMATAI